MAETLKQRLDKVIDRLTKETSAIRIAILTNEGLLIAGTVERPEKTTDIAAGAGSIIEHADEILSHMTGVAEKVDNIFLGAGDRNIFVKRIDDRKIIVVKAGAKRYKPHQIMEKIDKAVEEIRRVL